MADKDRKIQILKAAVKRFAKHGLNKTTLDEIARDLRIGKATIYNYFESKEELFYETIKWEAAQYIDEIKVIFNNEEISASQKFFEYIIYKENTVQKFRLLYELFILLLKDVGIDHYVKSFENELLILKELFNEEEKIICNVLTPIYNNKKESFNETLPSFLVMQSWGIFFSGRLFAISQKGNVDATHELFMKALGNILD